MKANRGLTLVELLIVIVIIGILAAVAVPAYTNYMQRARRVDAKTALEHLRATQEMFRAERGFYTININTLINMGVPAISGDYAISLNSATATTFIGRADPSGSPRQASDGILVINQDGVKTPADKWAK